MAITITKPTVGGSEDSWGTTINTALDTVVNAVNGTSGTLAPNLSTLTINSANVTATSAELNKLASCTSSTAELNKLTGLTASTAEMNHLVGVTSAIQTQINAKAPTASPTLTGTTTVATLALPENWTITVSGTGANSLLKVAYNGTDVLSLSTAGALIVEDNVTAFGSA